MNTAEIYQRYQISGDLQQHMRWVAQVANEVARN